MLNLRNPKVVFESIKSNFYTSLRDAIAKEDVVAVADDGKQLNYIHIAELHGVYGADETDGYRAIKIRFILQCTETGMVLADTNEFGVVPLDDFDFVGSKLALNKLKLKEIEKLVEKEADRLMKKEKPQNPYETRGLRDL